MVYRESLLLSFKHIQPTAPHLFCKRTSFDFILYFFEIPNINVSNDQVTPLGIFPSHVQSGKAIVSGLSQSNADGAFDKIPP